jgi:hypothetical protein
MPDSRSIGTSTRSGTYRYSVQRTTLGKEMLNTKSETTYLGELWTASEGFKCQVHGIVRECPWTFMDCRRAGDPTPIQLSHELRKVESEHSETQPRGGNE